MKLSKFILDKKGKLNLYFDDEIPEELCVGSFVKLTLPESLSKVSQFEVVEISSSGVLLVPSYSKDYKILASITYSIFNYLLHSRVDIPCILIEDNEEIKKLRYKLYY